MCEAKYFVLPYMLHNIIVVKYFNFGGNYGFDHKNYIGDVILKFCYAFSLLLNEK